MKPTLDFPAVSVVSDLTPESKRPYRNISPAPGVRRSAAQPGAFAAAPVRALPPNRVYLKALRQVELESWKANTTRDEKCANQVAKPVGPRLPEPTRDAWEGRAYALIALLGLAVLGYEVWVTFRATRNWDEFIRLVRSLLA